MVIRPLVTLPRLVCRSCAFARTDGGKELNFASGWPSIRFACNDIYRAVVPKAYETCNFREQQVMAGNSVCLQSVHAWASYVMSHVLTRESLSRLCPTLISSYSEAVACCRQPFSCASKGVELDVD